MVLSHYFKRYLITILLLCIMIPCFSEFSIINIVDSKKEIMQKSLKLYEFDLSDILLCQSNVKGYQEKITYEKPYQIDNAIRTIQEEFDYKVSELKEEYSKTQKYILLTLKLLQEIKDNTGMDAK